MNEPVIQNEAERLSSLNSYKILDTESEEAFNDIVKIAAQICNMPIALVTLVDKSRIWFKASHGVTLKEVPRENAFCHEAINNPMQTLVIKNTQKDERFSEHMLADSIGFYAGTPLLDKTGYALGTLCVLDTKPNSLTKEQIAIMEALSRQAMAQMELRKQNNILKYTSLVAEKTKNPVLISDKNRNIEYVNEAFEVLTGYKSEEVIGKSARSILYGKETNPEQIALIDQGIKEQVHFTQEILIYSKNGEKHWINCVVSPIFNEKGELEKVISVNSNITESKEEKEKLAAATEKALEGIKAKDQFLSNMSHEIRTPMNGIIGIANMILENDYDPEKCREMVGHISYSAQNLLTVINDILDFSKMNAEKLTFEQINFDLHNTFNALRNTVGFKAEQKGIDFKITLDNKLPKVVSGDPTRLNQILLNIVGNAIKFTELGHVEVNAHLEEFNEKGPRLCVTVEDTGEGIPDDKIGGIFEEFQQANEYNSRKHGGTGLGLSISKKLIEKFEGNIAVESTVDEGSTFSFDLQLFHPIIKEEPKEVVPVKAAPQVRKSTAKILLAEDNLMNQIIARNYIVDKFGFDMVVVDNGQDAVIQAEKEDFDIILMDVQMPVMNGLQATKNIRSKLPKDKNKIPILAMTASVMKHDLDLCYQAGMNDHISKPFQATELLKIMLKYINKAEELKSTVTP